MSWKLSRTVLRRGKGRNPFSLVEYLSTEYIVKTDVYQCRRSYSAKGNPYDNAVIESFHAILKKEEVYRKAYRDFDETRKSIFKYIEGWYNNRRIHGSIFYMTPNEFEALAVWISHFSCPTYWPRSKKISDIRKAIVLLSESYCNVSNKLLSEKLNISPSMISKIKSGDSKGTAYVEEVIKRWKEISK